MKVDLRVERESVDMNLFEGVEKVIKYRITNDNRFLVKDVDVTAKIIKEDGEETKGKYVKSITGITPRLLPNKSTIVNITIKLNKEYKESVIIDEKEELAMIELDLNVTATLVIGR